MSTATYETTAFVHGAPITVPCPLWHKFGIDASTGSGVPVVYLRHGEHRHQFTLDGIDDVRVDLWGSMRLTARTWVESVHREDMMQSDWPVF